MSDIHRPDGNEDEQLQPEHEDSGTAPVNDDTASQTPPVESENYPGYGEQPDRDPDPPLPPPPPMMPGAWQMSGAPPPPPDFQQSQKNGNMKILKGFGVACLGCIALFAGTDKSVIPVVFGAGFIFLAAAFAIYMLVKPSR